MLTLSDDANASLGERLHTRIRRDGPISFRDWMQTALYDEREGYYCRPDRIRQGRAGDYRTAPETSSLFAATFANYFAKWFADLGFPRAWTIFEAGAGLGEFAYGILNNLRASYPGVYAATSYVIDEVSPAAHHRAASRLSEFAGRLTFKRLAEIDHPATVGICFSNELIDAFPVHRVIGRNGKLRELGVGLNEDDFAWVERDPEPRVAEYCRRIDLQLSEGQIAEINLEAEGFISLAAGLVERGVLVAVDYGAERTELLGSPERFAGTLRAFHRHQIVDDVLARPGEQDLTTTVDWTQIREAGERARLETVRHERLDQFLLREGLLDMLERLASEMANEAEVLRLRTGAREMIMPHGMAAAFQILLQRKVLTPLA